jgi:hypothetical protein
LLDRVGGGDVAHLAALLYPFGPQIHYAVLNGRDRSFLVAAGVPEQRLHLLPNAVAMPSPPAQTIPLFPDHRLWLYPTRAIRRKNLGELLLWSMLGEENDLFAATQAPQNPAERPGYQRWVALAAELRLPVELEVGDRVKDFAGLLSSAHALVTTSVAEGYGLAFVEPWLVGRPLVGRDLPEITADFAATGLDLRGLYSRLEIPLDWLDTERLRRTMDAALREVMAAYGRKHDPSGLAHLWTTVVRDGRIDFGRLDETAQEEVIRHLSANPQDRSELRPPHLAAPAAADTGRITRNRHVAEQKFSISGYGQLLEAVYSRLLSEPVSRDLGAGDIDALLDRFLAPERLFLLRT